MAQAKISALEPWLLPAAKEAYKNREQIRNVLGALSEKLLGKKQTIAITGISGIGKTLLFDQLTGNADASGYAPPGKSETTEKGKTTAGGKRFPMVVIPGQESGNRLDALDNLLGGKQTVDGIVHVVANGFVEVRTETAKQELVERGFDTIDSVISHYRQDEFEELAGVCERIRQSHRKTRKPSWLLVAVTKYDLFYDKFNAVEKHYAEVRWGEAGEPESASAILEHLLDRVGSDNFRYNILPVCSWLESFEWNGETVISQLGDEERNHLLAKFVDQMAAFSD